MLSFIIFISCGEPAASSPKESIVYVEYGEESSQAYVDANPVEIIGVYDPIIAERLERLERLETEKRLESLQSISEPTGLKSNGLNFENAECGEVKLQEENLSHLNGTEKAKHKIKTATTKTDCMIEYLSKKDLGTIEQTYEEYCR